MGSQLQTGRISVTGNVTAVPDNKSVTLLTYTGTATSTQTMGTVPANKVWRIVYLQVSTAVDVGATTIDAAIILESVVGLGVVARRNTTSGGGGVSEAVNFDYGCCPRLVATDVVQISWPAGANVLTRACVGYVEEDA